MARLNPPTPVLLLTREQVRDLMETVTVAPISTNPRGLSSELALGPENGLDGPAVAQLDLVMTLPSRQLGTRIGHLLPSQEPDLAYAAVVAFDLDVTLYA